MTSQRASKYELMCPFGIARSPRHKGSFHSQSLFYEYPLGTHTHKKDWEQDRKPDRAPFSGPSAAAGETYPVNPFLLWNNSLKVLKEEQQTLLTPESKKRAIAYEEGAEAETICPWSDTGNPGTRILHWCQGEISFC